MDASDALTQFIADYKKEYNEDPSMFSALAYDATNVLIQSFEKAGSADTEAAQKAMTELDFKGVTGDFTFDETHTPKKAALVVELQYLCSDCIGIYDGVWYYQADQLCAW